LLKKVIAIGTGGIKPCVSAFGGNQFKENQKHHLDSFFSYFYASINVGSLIATFLTPFLSKKLFLIDIFFSYKVINLVNEF